jgi:hypothetical protein
LMRYSSWGRQSTMFTYPRRQLVGYCDGKRSLQSVKKELIQLALKKLALTSPTGGGRSVGIVRSWTKATEFSLVLQLALTTYMPCNMMGTGHTL